MSGVSEASGGEPQHNSILSRLFAKPLPNVAVENDTRGSSSNIMYDSNGMVWQSSASGCLYTETNTCDNNLSELPDIAGIKQEKADINDEINLSIVVEEKVQCPLEDELEPSVSENMMVNDYETRRNSFDEFGRRMSFSLDKKAPILASLFRISKKVSLRKRHAETAHGCVENLAAKDYDNKGMNLSCFGSSFSGKESAVMKTESVMSNASVNNGSNCDNMAMEVDDQSKFLGLETSVNSPQLFHVNYLPATQNSIVNVKHDQMNDSVQYDQGLSPSILSEEFVEAYPLSNISLGGLITEDPDNMLQNQGDGYGSRERKDKRSLSFGETSDLTNSFTFDSPGSHLSGISESDSSVSLATNMANGVSCQPGKISENKNSVLSPRLSCSENSGYCSGYSSDFCAKEDDYADDTMMVSRQCESRDSSVNQDDLVDHVTSPSTVSSPASYCSSSYSDYNSLSDTMFIPSPGSSSQLPINGDVMWSSPQSQNQLQVKVEHTAEASTTTHSPSLQGSANKKKRLSTVGKTVDEELCLICGDRASGYHYNALSCEGCKGFFRRSITRGASYSCKFGGHCEMDMWMRRKCQSCRLRRCREVGMKEECLLSEEQCKARDVRRKQRQRVIKPQQPDSSSPQPQEVKPVLEGGPVKDPLNRMSVDDKQVIEKIVVYQDRFELPSDDDVKNIAEVKISDLGRPKEMSEQIYKNMAEMTILVTQLVVEYAKHLPGFSTISREDQIVLLKGSASEVMMLRTARRYDIETDTIIFGNGVPMTRDSLRFGGLQDYVDRMFLFCHGMAHLGVDNAEYALLTAICILSDRPGLSEPHKCEALQDRYLNTFISYEFWRRPQSEHYLAKLLMKLTDLRTLSHEHAGILFALKVEKGSLPPLVTEYFDVVDQQNTADS